MGKIQVSKTKPMKNSEVARVLQDIADLLELKEENPSKIIMETKNA